jgi:hypothetical protein
MMIDGGKLCWIDADGTKVMGRIVWMQCFEAHRGITNIYVQGENEAENRQKL